ncbi:hypothetical protein M8J76_006500 [Diaphorina citri]|nr:hypothetical protein M8J76_006500 [Diaphorina citri]
MSGPPHTFQSSFANAQQRCQFNNQPGLINPQQPGIVNTFGGSTTSVGVGMQGQVSQPGQMQQNQQQTQQTQIGVQATGNVNQGVRTAATDNTNQPGPPQGPPQPAKTTEFNTASLCKFGQETVMDIVSRTQEVFQILKTIQPPNGTVSVLNASNDKRAKTQEQLKTIKLLFKRLRLIYEKCNECCQVQGMEYTHIEGLIPIKEDWDMKSDEKKTSEQYRVACDESKEIMEQVILKNRHLKEIIDSLRRIIWEINTMLTMRRS